MTLHRDMHRLGPAPTWERELAAAAANLALLVALLGVLVFVLDSRVGAAVLAVVGLGYQAVRLGIAVRRRRGEVSR